MDSAVIFDVDGVLLQLTSAEEDLFFEPFERRYGITGLSRDWDSYRVRNDEKIIEELFERHGLPAGEQHAVMQDYLALLQSSSLPTPIIAGAPEMLKSLSCRARLGIATANYRAAARLRLAAAGLWDFVSSYAFGAEGSGHKYETVGHAIAATGLPPASIVYIGDNLNDLEAGRRNGVHFIGFSTDENRRRKLAASGAIFVCGNHNQTMAIIKSLLRLD